MPLFGKFGEDVGESPAFCSDEIWLTWWPWTFPFPPAAPEKSNGDWVLGDEMKVW